MEFKSTKDASRKSQCLAQRRFFYHEIIQDESILLHNAAGSAIMANGTLCADLLRSSEYFYKNEQITEKHCQTENRFLVFTH